MLFIRPETWDEYRIEKVASVRSLSVPR